MLIVVVDIKEVSMTKNKIWELFKKDNKSFVCYKCGATFAIGADFLEIKEQEKASCLCWKCFMERR